jgi:hypothetical protein
MGRHSMRSYKPAHSAHGTLYWAVTMWPVVLRRALADTARRALVRAPATPRPKAVVPGTVRPSPPSALATTWRTEEGAVKPSWDRELTSA